MYDHIICGGASVHFKLNCSCVCTWLERRYMYIYFEKVNIVFLCIMQPFDTSGTSKHQELASACTVSSCHINTGSGVRRIIFKRQQCMYKSEQWCINENLLTQNARLHTWHFFGYSEGLVTKISSLQSRLIFRRCLIEVCSAWS